MRTLASVSQTVLRFRRWCRKGYAVFCSLGKCVTIGTLSKGIADRSLGKQALHATGFSVCCHPASGEEEWPNDAVSGDVLSVSPMATAPWLMAWPFVGVGMAVMTLDGTLAGTVGSEKVYFLFKLIKDREDAVFCILPVLFLMSLSNQYPVL